MEVWPTDPPGILLPLDPYLKQRRFNKADYWWSKYYQETEDGRIFSLPMGAYVGGMVANVDLFERAGVKLPAKDWTFADLRDIARRAQDRPRLGRGAPAGGLGPGLDELARQRRRRVVRPQDAQDDLRHGARTGASRRRCSPTGRAWCGATAWRPTRTRSTRCARTPASPAGPLFATGLIALSGFPFYQAGLQKEAIAGRFRFQALWPPTSPYSGRRGYHLETNCITVNKLTKAPDEAFDLAYYWLTDDMSRFLAANLPVMPPGRKWHRSKEVTSVAPGMEIFPDVADEAQKIGNDRHKWQGGTGASPKSLEWLRAMRAPLEAEALTKGTDPRAAFREAVAAGDRALA